MNRIIFSLLFLMPLASYADETQPVEAAGHQWMKVDDSPYGEIYIVVDKKIVPNKDGTKATWVFLNLKKAETDSGKSYKSVMFEYTFDCEHELVSKRLVSAMTEPFLKGDQRPVPNDTQPTSVPEHPAPGSRGELMMNMVCNKLPAVSR